MGTIMRQSLLIGGQVQGVGFRPFVYRCALKHGLSGSVGNTPQGVEIQIQGSPTALDAFYHELHSTLPPLARIQSCQKTALPPRAEEQRFEIKRSDGGGNGHSVLVSPDVAMCAQCQQDIADPHNRRYRYPFTNCTNCGPRYTITRSIPYDRATTSMGCFPLCPDCDAEYHNPLDRRFHAQPNACARCGPALWTVDRQNMPAYTGPPAALGTRASDHIRPLQDIALALQAGRIAAIKGLGGFQLACDAFNPAAIARLRARKHRPHKALAVMVPDIASARALAQLTPAHEALLLSAEAPIVLCPKRPNILPESIAPDGHSVGLMLPYTPLHRVLLDMYSEMVQQSANVQYLSKVCAPSTLADQPVLGLVMTSGNAGGEPICLGNREALDRLSDIADIFLLHSRDILVRADDSVVMPEPIPLPSTAGPVAAMGNPLLYRRARGYVPRPLALPAQAARPLAAGQSAPKAPNLLGVGAELKSTLCLTRGDAAFVSQHIGDVQNLETFKFYQEVAAHFECLLEVHPDALVCDLHPDYLSSQYARNLAAERALPLLYLQHHAAHGWSVLSEHGHSGPALVWALDGTGLGTQGPLGGRLTKHESTTQPELWGGELLLIDTVQVSQKRIGSLRSFPLAGGDAAVREPWRVAQGLLWQLGKAWQWPEPYAKNAVFIEQMLAKQVQCPTSSSLGRLFDAVAALLGLCYASTYEGQAAVRLQEAQCVESAPAALYPVRIISPADEADKTTPTGAVAEADKTTATGAIAETGEAGAAGTVAKADEAGEAVWRLDTQDFFAHIYADMQVKSPVAHIARKFHLSLAHALADMSAQAALRHGLHTVGLSGGVMQNPSLHAALPKALAAHGLQALLHKDLPPNDACISFGQAAFGRAFLLRNRPWQSVQNT